MIRSRSLPLLSFILSGIAAGLINGLLGAGGGIVAVFALGRTMRSVSRPDELEIDSRDLFANALAAMLPVTVISLIGYRSDGALEISRHQHLIFPALLGGATGALLLDKIKVDVARRIFCVIVVLSGIIMLVRDSGGRL